MPAPSPFVPLPGQGASPSVRTKARRSFDTIAHAYDQARPGYPDALFDDLRAHGLWPGAAVLEVGCGTGQATRQLAETAVTVLDEGQGGGEVRCVELGGHLAARARQNLAPWPNVTVREGVFEDIELPAQSFDLVFSATAFHWIDPTIGFAKAAALIRAGGSMALATNAHVAGGTQEEISVGITELQADLCPEVGAWRFPSRAELIASATAGGDLAHLWARVDRSFGVPPDVRHLFALPFVGTYEWTATYRRDDYLAMLGTHSTYVTLPSDRRARLFDGIGALIDDRLGGYISKTYLAILAVASRQSVGCWGGGRGSGRETRRGPGDARFRSGRPESGPP